MGKLTLEAELEKRCGVFMEITEILETNYHAFENILPKYKKKRPACLWGCVVDDTAVGAVAVDIINDSCSIEWLWVAPGYRKKGIGGALLDTACKAAIKWSKQQVTLTYSADEVWSDVIEYMLWMRGFQVSEQSYPMYWLQGEALVNAPFLTKVDLIGDAHVVSLSKLTRSQMQELLAECKASENYYVSHAEYERADETRSKALIQNGHIQGIILMSAFGEEDQLSLDLLYVRKSDLRSVLALMQQTAVAALKHPSGLREFRFICTEEVAEKLCQRLLGNQKPVMMKYCHGMLQTNLYQERSKAYV